MSPQRLATDLQRARNELQVEHQRVEQLLTKVEELQAELDRVRNSASLERDSRIQAEDALDMTRDRLELAVDAANLALWDWQISAPEMFLSARWGEMVSAGAVEGYWSVASFRESVHPNDFGRLKATFEALLSGQSRRIMVQYRVRSMDKKWLWIETHGMVAERDAAGKPLRVMGTHADISERKRIEEEVERARHAAEQASQAKGDFLANISHEVRTPLNALMGLTHLLLDTQLSEEQRKWLELMDGSARALLALLNDVLDISRIEAGQLNIENVPFDATRLLREVVQLHQAQAQAKAITISTRLDPHLPPQMMGDPNRLRQVLINLLSNALKFTPEGGQIELSADTTGNPSKPGQALRLQVKDNGIGIAKERQAAIFEAFTQADTSTSRRYGGSGLGLTICSRLVQLMDGCISLTSEVGQGSTFTVLLPLMENASSKTKPPAPGAQARVTPSIPPAPPVPPAPPAPPALSATASPAALDGRFKGLHVLVAEDHPVNELLIRKLLERQGCKVQWAHDGNEAVSMWQSGGVDLVLMDVQMPVADGLQATRRIRALEELQNRPRTPIIALTANAINGDQHTCLEAGMDGYASKPIFKAELFQTMEKVLTGTSTPASDVQSQTTPTRGPSISPIIQLFKDLDVTPDSQRRFLQTLDGELPIRQENLRAAMENKDLDLAMSQAHLLKGSLDLIQADRSARLARGLEMAARAGEWNLFGKVLTMLNTEIETLRNVLTQGKSMPGA